MASADMASSPPPSMYRGAQGGGDSPLPTETLEAEDLESQLRQRIALLTGGRDRRGGAILSFPCSGDGNSGGGGGAGGSAAAGGGGGGGSGSATVFSKEELKYLLTYLVHIPTLTTQELGFTILVDMRHSSASWSNTKVILQVRKIGEQQNFN